jgi:hypothetical protein
MNSRSMHGQTAGLIVAAVVGVADVATLGFATSDGSGPPWALAALVAILGLVTLVAVLGPWHRERPARKIVIGTRVVSALAAVPGVAVADVSAGIRVGAGATVVLDVVAVVLLARSLRHDFVPARIS